MPIAFFARICQRRPICYLGPRAGLVTDGGASRLSHYGVFIDMICELANFVPTDAEAINRIALAAFRQYRHDYDDWPAFSRLIGDMAALADSGELIVARRNGRIAGAVAYAGPGKKKPAFFPTEWPVLRMLVVDPAFRGMGIGRILSEACIGRAVRDGAPLIALHTSPIMKVALPMYERMGFRFERMAPAVFGVPYGIYVLELSAWPWRRAGRP